MPSNNKGGVSGDGTVPNANTNKDAGTPSSKMIYQQRRVFKKPTAVTIRQPKFEGKCEELKGHIYDCSDSRQADIYIKTTRELA